MTLWQTLLLIIGFPLAFVACSQVFRLGMPLYHAWGLSLFCCLVLFYPLRGAGRDLNFGQWSWRSLLACCGVAGVLHIVCWLFERGLHAAMVTP
jgi:hypothetical protein